MTRIPQIPLFSLVKHGKTYSDNPPPLSPSFLLPKNLSYVFEFLLSKTIYGPSSCRGWVGGRVASKKYCGQKQEHFPPSLTVYGCSLWATLADGKQQRSAFSCGFSCRVQTRCNVARFLRCSFEFLLPLFPVIFMETHRRWCGFFFVSASLLAFDGTHVGAERLGCSYSSSVHAVVCVCVCMCVCVCVRVRVC